MADHAEAEMRRCDPARIDESSRRTTLIRSTRAPRLAPRVAVDPHIMRRMARQIRPLAGRRDHEELG
jgi:hypothetical protein